MNEIMRIVDVIHREKDIDKELIFIGIEQSILLAAKRHFGKQSEVECHIDRLTGEIHLIRDSVPVDYTTLGRIAAQTAKQVIIQKIREAERDVVLRDYAKRVREMVSGTIQRVEGSSVYVNLGRTEGFLPRSEQVRGELYRPGDRVRCLILEVRQTGPAVQVILSRTHPDLIRRLFEMEVPEILEHIIEIKVIVREPGFRTKIAVYSVDSRVDAVGACVGVRGSRIKNIVDELGGEKIDIIRWSDTPELLIGNSLKPAEVSEIFLYAKTRRAEVIVADDQLSLSIGRRGQNVRLASKLCGWEIDVYSREQMKERSTTGRTELSTLPGIEEVAIGHLIENGIGCWKDIVVKGEAALMRIEGVGLEKAKAIYEFAAVRQKEKDEEAAKKAAEAAAAANPEALPAAGEEKTEGEREGGSKEEKKEEGENSKSQEAAG